MEEVPQYPHPTLIHDGLGSEYIVIKNNILPTENNSINNNEIKSGILSNLLPKNDFKIRIKQEQTKISGVQPTDNYSDYNKSNEYSLLIMFSLLGGLLLISSFDLISMYLSIELQSFALYILACLFKDKLSSTSAGLKYFLLGGLSSCLILFGSGILFSYTGTTSLETLNYIITVYFNDNVVLTISELFLNDNIYTMINLKAYSISIILICVGFLFKIAAAPFHNWSFGLFVYL